MDLMETNPSPGFLLKSNVETESSGKIYFYTHTKQVSI